MQLNANNAYVILIQGSYSFIMSPRFCIFSQQYFREVTRVQMIKHA